MDVRRKISWKERWAKIRSHWSKDKDAKTVRHRHYDKIIPRDPEMEKVEPRKNKQSKSNKRKKKRKGR